MTTPLLSQTVSVVNGVATLEVDTTDIPEGNYDITATYQQNNTYREASDTGTLLVEQAQPQAVDPWSGLLDTSNWGTYPTGTSGANQTGNTTALTSSDATVDTTNQYIQFKQTKYFVYNKTLDDLLTYYNNEFSIIAYKGGGDGWFDLGFVNTTTGGYKLGYISCITRSARARNQENNVNVNLGSSRDFLYQNWNECTFKKEGTDLVLYWKGHGSAYTSQALALGSIDPEKYYFYVKGCTQSDMRLTLNNSLIQNYSMSSHEP